MHINMIPIPIKILNGSGSKAPAYIQSEPITNTLEANLCVFLQTTGFSNVQSIRMPTNPFGFVCCM